MEILLDKRAVRQIRLSAQDAIEEGDIETLREDILEAFTEEQVEEIERRLDSGDFFEFLTDMLDEWSGDDADELFELIDTQLGDVGVNVKFEKKAPVDEEDDDSSPASPKENSTTRTSKKTRTKTTRTKRTKKKRRTTSSNRPRPRSAPSVALPASADALFTLRRV